jgi:glutaredoxin
MIFKETNMRLKSLLQAAAVLVIAQLSATAALAQYKYIGPDGRVVYSDQPPPPSAKGAPAAKAAPVPAAASSSSGAGLPFALQQAIKNFPVTLYTTTDCDSCAQGRALLGKRGVPFTEKTVRTQDDIKIFRDATGATQVPVMTLGSNKQVGFEEGAWNGALNAAGYPPNNLLPASYKNPAAAPAAPFTPESKTASGPGGSPATGAPGAQGNAPAGNAPSSNVPSPDAGNKPPNWFKGF